MPPPSLVLLLWTGQWLPGEGFNSLLGADFPFPREGARVLNATGLPQILSDPGSAGLQGRAGDCRVLRFTERDPEELQRITERNCRAVRRVSKLNFGAANTASWTRRIQSAIAKCEDAEADVAKKIHPVAAANLALDAWGTILMSGRECCNMVDPPYCQSPRKKKVVHAVPVVIVLILALLLLCTDKCCGRCVRYPKLCCVGSPRKRRADEVEVRGPTSATGRSSESDMKSKLKLDSDPGTVDPTSMKDLLGETPSTQEMRDDMIQIFAKLYVAFGFQEDNVRNQYEHFLSLWRGQYSMEADKGNYEGHVEELLGQGLERLHRDMLAGYKQWLRKWKQHTRPGRAEAAAELPYITTDKKRHVRQLLELACFLLVWGEAGNLRFMPEVLYFVLDLALRSFGGASGGREFEFQPGGRQDRRFLAHIVRPIYNAVFDENYDCVAGKGKKMLREGYEAFLPADCANYDDWTELFNDPARLVDELRLRDTGTRFHDAEGGCFKNLPLVDWPGALRGNKSHRELHSLWGLYAATHRIWFLHTIIFLFTFCLAELNVGVLHPESKGLRVQLTGSRWPERFATVGLLIPLHGLLWSITRFVSRGKDVHRKRCGNYRSCTCCAVLIRSLFQSLFWVMPLLSYAWVRYNEITGQEVHLRIAALLSHLLLSLVGTVVILILPVGTTAADGSCFGFLFAPDPDVMIWNLTPVNWDTRFCRWIFWITVFAVKSCLGYASVKVMVQTVDALGIAFVDNEAIEDLVRFSFQTSWDRDVIWYGVFFVTSFIMYCTDTLFWFHLMTCVYGPVIAMYQRAVGRGTDMLHVAAGLLFSDGVHKIPELFKRKVLRYLEVPAQGWNQDNAFAAIWNRVIDVMHYESKLSPQERHMLKYERRSGAGQVEAQAQEGLGLGPDFRGSRDALAVEELHRYSPAHILNHQTCLHRYITRDLPCSTVSGHWPKVLEIQWRLEAMARCLCLPMPTPFRAPYIPGWTTMIPHYGEDIIRSKDSLYKQSERDVVPMMSWIHDQYPAEYAELQQRKARDIPANASQHWSLVRAEEGWQHLRNWASMHTQTLFRTVAGVTLYRLGLLILAEVQGARRTDLERKLMRYYEESGFTRDVFTCLIAMQRYAEFKEEEYENAEQILDKYGESVCIAFIDAEPLVPPGHDPRGPQQQADDENVHPDQEFRYFSCRVTKKCNRRTVNGKVAARRPDFSVELPGFPILGDGKGDNQNSAIIFSRGLYIQVMDMNQGGYLEQMLFMPCVLGEFRDNNQMIVGLPEHITSDIGSIGDFAASAEQVFGTMMQRVYAFMGARMHYGHPDIMSKLWVMQQGGVSKAIKTVNLSEDIFAGMDFTLRGAGLRGQRPDPEHRGRAIKHAEYMYLGKGRDLGFSLVLTFFMKLAAGTGEQVLTRQMYRLGHTLGLPEFLTFYYAHAGFYISQFLISRSVPLLMFLWLLVILGSGDAEYVTGAAFSAPRTEIMAEYFASSYSWVLILFIVASMFPVVVEAGMAEGLVKALLKCAKQLFTLAPLHFIFQSKVIGIYIMSEIQYGGATYMATGRDLPTKRESFMTLYKMFVSKSFYDGARLLVGMSIAWMAGGLHSGPGHDGLRLVYWLVLLALPWTWWGLGCGAAVAWFTGWMPMSASDGSARLDWWMVSVTLPCTSWLLAPFIFNPYQYNLAKFLRDFLGKDGPREFFFGQSGHDWCQWYEDSQLKPSAGLRRSVLCLFIQVLPIFCWYSAVNSKLHILEVQVARMVAAPLVPSALASLALAALVTLVNCCYHRPAQPPSAAAWQATLAQEGAFGAEKQADIDDAKWKARDIQDLVSMLEGEEGPRTPATPGGLVECAFIFPLVDLATACVSMSTFFSLGWWKTIAASLLLQYWWLSFLLFTCECLLRIPAAKESPQCPEGTVRRGKRARERAATRDKVPGALSGLVALIKMHEDAREHAGSANPISNDGEHLNQYRWLLEAHRHPKQLLPRCVLDWLRLWLYSHRLAMDLLVASLISVLLIPGLISDKLNELVLPQFNFHTMLVYRAARVPGESRGGAAGRPPASELPRL